VANEGTYVTHWHFIVSFKCALWHLCCKYGTLLALQKCHIALYCHMALFWQIINQVPYYTLSPARALSAHLEKIMTTITTNLIVVIYSMEYGDVSA